MAASMNACLPSLLLEKCDEVLKRPEDFLVPRKKLSKDLKTLTKRLYDAVKDYETKHEKSGKSDALPELIIDGFDDEQIWQELELQNDAFHGQALKGVSRLLAAKDHAKFVLLPDHSSSSADVTDAEDDGDDNDEEEEEVNDERSVDGDDVVVSDADEDDAMSDTSVELEKALDKKIAFDKEHGLQSDSDDEGDQAEADDEEEEDHADADEVDQESSEDKDDSNLLDQAEKTTKDSRAADFDKPHRQSEVDDQFFRLDELEEFLKAEDHKEMRRIDGKDDESAEEDEADLELFEDFKDEYGEEDKDNVNVADENWRKSARFLRYKDFFDPPRRQIGLQQTSTDDVSDKHEVTLDEQWTNRHKRNVDNPAPKRKRQLLDDDNRDNNDDDFSESRKSGEDQSAFEKRQEKIKQRIRQLEESNLSAKSWQMMGEASSAIRPENSLLQEHLYFDHMTKQAPVITEETTIKLEDIIKQRIKDQIWDDVERKIKPTEEPFEFKKKIVLDQEKSKISLAEVYEQEYVKQQQTETEIEKEEPKDHKEIRKNMALLFAKLDALSNFHFIPKPARPELKVVNNLPAITVEEVAPVSVSDAMLLAPEEITEKPKGVEIGRSERTITDKKRERREKKTKQRAKEKRRQSKEKLVAKLNPGLGNKYSKMAAMKKLTDEDNVTVIEKSDKSGRRSLASSKNFFSQLQEEVKTSIKSKKTEKSKEKKTKMSVSKLKL